MQILATICARAGSKGVPNKNIREMLGKPLIGYTVEQATRSGLFKTIAVSSDSAEIIQVGKRFGADLGVLRPKELALDTAGKIPAIQHCVLAAEKSTGIDFEIIVDLDTTSPLRDIEDIKACVRILQSRKIGNVLTAAPSRRSPYFNMVETNDSGVPIPCKNSRSILRRQDAPPTYDMNASIYVWRRESLFGSTKPIFLDDTFLYVMPEERSLDIDTELDFEMVEFLMAKKAAQSTSEGSRLS